MLYDTWFARVVGLEVPSSDTVISLGRRMAKEKDMEALVIATLRARPDSDNLGDPHAVNSNNVLLVTTVLHNLSDDAGPLVLWAASYWLDLDVAMPYVRKKRLFLGVKLSHSQTPPLRDSARSALVRIIGADYGYDQDNWRKAILARHASQ